MVPSGKSVDDTIDGLLPLLSPSDVIIDGGNSYYQDSMGLGRSPSATCTTSMLAPVAVSGG